ncbi:MAG: hypothetical protein ACR650_04910 [Methylocystis sp.]|jgi:hypothetical protein
MHEDIDEEKQKRQPDVSPMGLMFDPMEQMRELLFGATKRETERQICVLESKLDETRKDFLARFDALNSLILALAHETEKNRSDSITAIGGALVELGDKIKAMSEKQKV